MKPNEAIDVFAPPHYVLVGRDSEKVDRLTETLKRFLHDRAVSFVRAHRDEPLLEVFMSDGTPMTTANRVVRKLQSEVIRRSGRCCREYLMQLCF